MVINEYESISQRKERKRKKGRKKEERKAREGGKEEKGRGRKEVRRGREEKNTYKSDLYGLPCASGNLNAVR